MNTIERIEVDFKEALKKKDVIAISTLRMVKAAIHNREIEKKGQALSEEEVIKVISKQAQQHQEAIKQFKQGRRDDLAEKETKELGVLKGYLPKQLTEEEVLATVKRIIEAEGVKDKSGFGKVMKLAMAQIKGAADGKLVSRIVAAQLKSGEKDS